LLNETGFTVSFAQDVFIHGLIYKDIQESKLFIQSVSWLSN